MNMHIGLFVGQDRQPNEQRSLLNDRGNLDPLGAGAVGAVFGDPLLSRYFRQSLLEIEQSRVGPFGFGGNAVSPGGFTSKLERPQPWLDTALRELTTCREEAREEDMPAPTAIALLHAERILREVASFVGPLIEPSVYPTHEAEIGISFRNRATRSAVTILCEANGGASWYAHIGGKNRRAHSDSASDLPDHALTGQLSKLSEAVKSHASASATTRGN